MQIPNTPFMNMADVQLANEHIFNQEQIYDYIKEEVLEYTEHKYERIEQQLIEFVSQEYYESKSNRLRRFQEYTSEQWHALITLMATKCAYCVQTTLYTNITAQIGLQAHSDFDFVEKVDSIKCIAEFLVVLAEHDLIDINLVKSGGAGEQYDMRSLAVTSKIPLSKSLVKFANYANYLPPLVYKPKDLRNNRDSAYLTLKRNIVLNKGDRSATVALDVLNKQNQTALTLDLEFLLNTEELPNKELGSVDKRRAWNIFVESSEEMYLRIFEQSQGNREIPGAIYFDHRYDKRGRMYCSGYHISYQGSPYKKAMLELAAVEYTEVPEEYQIKEITNDSKQVTRSCEQV